MKFLGSCMGVELFERGNDNHIAVKLLVEDDGTWHDNDWFDSAWLDELIDVLTQAKIYCERNFKKDEHGYDLHKPDVKKEK
jgi:hypothetical protein